MPAINTDVPVTWDELLDDYFFSRNLRPVTEWSYRKVVKGFLAYAQNNTAPENITHRSVLMWRRFILKEKKQSAQTWNNKISHLRSVYNFGMESELLTVRKNPFNSCTVQREKKKKKTLDKSQLTRVYLILQALESKEAFAGNSDIRNALYPAWYWLTVLDTLRYTGLRQNQLLHIRLRDVCVPEGYLDLRLEGSKTHREWRVPTVKALRLRLCELIRRATLAGAGADDMLFDVNRFAAGVDCDNYVYNAAKNYQKLRAFFRRLSKECGFAVSPHRFRHTLATELMKSPDRNLQLVRDLLGHRNVSTTMEYVELRMDVAGKTLEEELSLHTDICVERDLQLLTEM